MKKFSVVTLSLLALSPAFTSRLAADYPVASHRYLADPSTLVYNGRLYVYCSNDDDNTGSSYAMKSLVCVSTADLKNWTDHGEVFRVPTNASWANYAWAPAAVARNGKIYLYFGNNASGVGVASSTSPTGTFSDAKGGYLVNSSTPGASGTNMWYFDPSVLIDSDGQAYLTFGGNGESNCRIIRLNTDMISVSGSAASITLPGYFEASFLHKRNGLYYLSYSTNTANGLRIDYATSSSPMSGYTRRGIAAGQPPENNNNNHASIVDFNGTWYHVYHNRVISRAAGSGVDPTYHRNLGIERLNYNGDGTIQQVTYTTDGMPQVGTLNPYARVEAETFAAQSGVETEKCSEGGMNVGYLQNGDWVRIRGVNFGSTPARGFSARVASATSGGNIEIRLDSASGSLIGTCSVAGTGGWQTWTTRTTTVSGTTGTHDVYLRFTGGSGFLFNVNWWQFTN
jgi:arabinoxylan arabinofuranohydrolase